MPSTASYLPSCRFVIHQTHSSLRSTVLNGDVSRSLWLTAVCRFMCNTLNRVVIRKRLRRNFPDAPVRSKTIFKRMKDLEKVTKNWAKLVPGWRHFRDSIWLEFHSKQSCLRHHHHHGMRQNCSIFMYLSQVCFTNSTTKLVQQDWILWTGTSMECVLEESIAHLFV